jgi:hypothetical protein
MVIINSFLITTFPVLSKFGMRHLWYKVDINCKFHLQGVLNAGSKTAKKRPIFVLSIHVVFLKKHLLECYHIETEYII